MTSLDCLGLSFFPRASSFSVNGNLYSPVSVLPAGMLIDYAVLIALVVGSLIAFSKYCSLPLVAFGVADVVYGFVVFGKMSMLFNGWVALVLLFCGLLFAVVGIRRKLNSE